MTILGNMFKRRVRLKTALVVVSILSLILLLTFVDVGSMRSVRSLPSRKLQIARITADDVGKVVGQSLPSSPSSSPLIKNLDQELVRSVVSNTDRPFQIPFQSVRDKNVPFHNNIFQYDLNDIKSKGKETVKKVGKLKPIVDRLAQIANNNSIYTKEKELIALSPFSSMPIDKRKKLEKFLSHLSEDQFQEFFKTVVGYESVNALPNFANSEERKELVRKSLSDVNSTELSPVLIVSDTQTNDAVAPPNLSKNQPNLSKNILESPKKSAKTPQSRYRARHLPHDRSDKKACLNGGCLHSNYGYSARVAVESVSLPNDWTTPSHMGQRIQERKNRLKNVCHKHRLDEFGLNNTINAWEFVYSPQHKLLWCSIFKAASSTWFYNFNILAGYTENRLLKAKETPVMLARKKYPRLTVNDLDHVLNQTERPLSFMIVRHPLTRLVSGYRDKLLPGRRYYSNISRRIVQEYPHLGDRSLRAQANPGLLNSILKRSNANRRVVVPTFPQFVQYIIDASKRGESLDEHWTPMYKFCSPCLFEFDVIAKMETLDEDGNYLIFQSGIQDTIKPKHINRNRNAPTDKVAESFLCQLSRQMMLDLIEVYKYDLEIFDYDYEQYINCTTDTVRLQKTLRS